MRSGEVVRQAFADLLGGLAIEGEHEDLVRRDALVAHEVGDLRGDHRRLARARTRQHQRRVLVRGDRLGLLAGRRRGEHARRSADHGGSSGSDEAGVRLLPRRLERVEAGDPLEAGERLGGAGRQVGSRQRAAALLYRVGDVRLEPAAQGLADVAVRRVEAAEAGVEPGELRGQRLRGASRVLADRLGDPFRLAPVESADGALDTAGLADRQPRPEPGAARLDAVDGADGRAGGSRAAAVLETQRAIVERDAGGAGAEQPHEGGAGRGDRAGVWGHRRSEPSGVSRSAP